jgi:hypothetical protein
VGCSCRTGVQSLYGDKRTSVVEPQRPVQVRIGSKYEELNVSKSGPPCLGEQTSMKRVATSLMGPLKTSSSVARQACFTPASEHPGPLSNRPTPFASA